MGLKKIYVSRDTVVHNKHTGLSDPIFTVFEGENKHKSNSIILLGPSEIKYDAQAPEGARVWIETYDKVILKYENDSEPDRPSLVAV